MPNQGNVLFSSKTNIVLWHAPKVQLTSGATKGPFNNDIHIKESGVRNAEKVWTPLLNGSKKSMGKIIPQKIILPEITVSEISEKRPLVKKFLNCDTLRNGTATFDIWT